MYTDGPSGSASTTAVLLLLNEENRQAEALLDYLEEEGLPYSLADDMAQLAELLDGKAGIAIIDTTMQGEDPADCYRALRSLSLDTRVVFISHFPKAPAGVRNIIRHDPLAGHLGLPATYSALARTLGNAGAIDQLM